MTDDCGFDLKYFTLNELREMCNPNTCNGYSPLIKQCIESEIQEHKINIQCFKFPFDFQYFTFKGLIAICIANKLYMEWECRDYVEYRMREFHRTFSMESLFSRPFYYKYFTVEGLRVLCEMNNVNSMWTTRREYIKALNENYFSVLSISNVAEPITLENTESSTASSPTNSISPISGCVLVSPVILPSLPTIME